jgi:hypothetical protein
MGTLGRPRSLTEPPDPTLAASVTCTSHIAMSGKVVNASDKGPFTSFAQFYPFYLQVCPAQPESKLENGILTPCNLSLPSNRSTFTLRTGMELTHRAFKCPVP